MRLDYETGNETIAWVEPGIEQHVVVAGLAAVSKGIKNRGIRLDGGFRDKRKAARQLETLRENIATHLSQNPDSVMCMMGDFELEMAQKGVDRILESGEFGNSFMPAAPGASELDLELIRIAGEAKMRMYAETMSLALMHRVLLPIKNKLV